jgi:hypothetical protein
MCEGGGGLRGGRVKLDYVELHTFRYFPGPIRPGNRPNMAKTTTLLIYEVLIVGTLRLF